MLIKTVTKRDREGFGWYQDGKIYLNLKRISNESSNFRDFIKFFKETVVHEHIHYLISKWKVNTRMKEEEKICRVMEKF